MGNPRSLSISRVLPSLQSPICFVTPPIHRFQGFQCGHLWGAIIPPTTNSWVKIRRRFWKVEHSHNANSVGQRC
jgi:hypothetical protein